MATEVDNLRRTSARDLHREFQLVLDRVDAALDSLGALLPGTVDSEHIVDTAIIESKLADLAVTLAKIQDGAVDLDTKVTEGTRKLVANMAGFLLRGIFKPDQLNGSPNAGEIDFDPIEAGEDYVTFLPDGSVVEVSNANRSLMSQGAQESYTGRVFIVFSKTPSNSSRGLSAFQDSHILIVRFNNGTYQYDDNGAWQSFTPLSTDICIYDVDRSGAGWTGMPTRYVGMELLAYMEMRERVDAALDDFGQVLANRVLTTSITDDAITSPKIAAGAVLAEKLLIANFFNLLADPSFEDSDLNNHWLTTTNGGTWDRVATDGAADPYHGSWMARYQVSGQSANAYLLGTLPAGSLGVPMAPGHIQASEGERFSLRVRHRMAPGGGAPSGAYLRGYFQFQGPSGSTLSSGSGAAITPSTSAWGTLEFTTDAAPAGAAYVIIGITIENSADSAQRYLLDAFECNRTSGSVYIEDGAVTADKVVAGAITTAKLAAGAVTANEIAANTITAAQIAAATITAAQIAAGTITATELAALSVGTDELIANSVTGGKIAALTITAGLIQANAIETAKINGLAVTTGKLDDNAANIFSHAITAEATSISSFTETTVQTLSFTSTGEPIMFLFGFAQELTSGCFQLFETRLYRDSTELLMTPASASSAFSDPVFGSWSFVDDPGAGTYSYTVKITLSGGTPESVDFTNKLIIASENLK